MISVLFTYALFALDNGDFVICQAENVQSSPDVVFAESLFYVFWVDFRNSAAEQYCIYGARVTINGTVLDLDGKLVFKNRAETPPAAAYDGTNLLVVLQDSC